MESFKLEGAEFKLIQQNKQEKPDTTPRCDA